MSATTVPQDIGALARWLASDPKGRAPAFRRLVIKLDKSSFEARRASLRAGLHEAWDEESADFFELLDSWRGHRSARLRYLAAGAVALVEGPRFELGLSWLRGMITDNARDVRAMAVERLCAEVNAAPDDFRRFSLDKDPRLREIAARHIQDIDEPEALGDAIKRLCIDRDPAVHWAAAVGLHRIFERADNLAKEAAQLMGESDDHDVRWAVVSSFYEPIFADGFDRYLPMMRQWIRSGDRNLRWTLAHALRFVKPSPRVLAIVRSLFEEKDPLIRRRLLWQLEQMIGAVDLPEIDKLLEKGCKDSSKRVRDLSNRVLEIYQEKLRKEQEAEAAAPPVGQEPRGL